MRSIHWRHIVGMIGLVLTFLYCTSNPGAVQDRPETPGRLSNGTLDAQNLAIFLGIDAWVFEYEGGYPKCWVEITEEGQNTVDSRNTRLEIAETNHLPEAKKGKILLFLKRGELHSRIQSGISRSDAAAGLAQDALWWGWKGGAAGQSAVLQKTVKPKPGEEVTLLNLSNQEFKNPSAKDQPQRKVRLLFKVMLTE
jgi:hypothetical protein